LWFLATPEAVQVTELIQHRSYDLGYPMSAEEAKALTVEIFKNRGTISIPVILATIEIESRYDRKARSKKNCKGYLQLSPGTAKTMATRLGISRFNIFDVATNIKLGVYYLAELLKENVTIGHALTIYNAGWKGYVRRGKKMSHYAKAVLRRSHKIEAMLGNDLFCKK
jgi:soluble lytic murein transglycosylase-like protein